MDNNGKVAEKNPAAKKRRAFLKKAGKFGVTAPMAMLLLSVKSKSSRANEIYGYDIKPV